MRTMKTGNICETVFLNDIEELSDRKMDLLIEHITNFCVDGSGRIMQARGRAIKIADIYCVGYNERGGSANLLTVELPNPATNISKYQKIRGIMLDEIKARLNVEISSLTAL